MTSSPILNMLYINKLMCLLHRHWFQFLIDILITFEVYEYALCLPRNTASNIIVPSKSIDETCLSNCLNLGSRVQLFWLRSFLWFYLIPAWKYRENIICYKQWTLRSIQSLSEERCQGAQSSTPSLCGRKVRCMSSPTLPLPPKTCLFR
jgi:hypothetical protein